MKIPDPYDHRPDREGVAHARAESRPRRDSDQLVAAGWLIVVAAYLVAAWLVIDGVLMPWIGGQP